MKVKELIGSIVLCCSLLQACETRTAKKPASDKADTTSRVHAVRETGFNGYITAIPEITLPYEFAFARILAKGTRMQLDVSRLTPPADDDRYYEPDPDAAYAQLPAAYQGAIAYPVFRYQVNAKFTAVAYAFHKVSSRVVYYPFVELVIFDAAGKIKGRQVIASGTKDAQYAENTVFTIITPTQINTVNHMYEYADSTRTGESINYLQDKRSFYIQPDGHITK